MWWVGIFTSIAMVEGSFSYFPLLILDNCHFGLLKMFLIKLWPGQLVAKTKRHRPRLCADCPSHRSSKTVERNPCETTSTGSDTRDPRRGFPARFPVQDPRFPAPFPVRTFCVPTGLDLAAARGEEFLLAELGFYSK